MTSTSKDEDTPMNSNTEELLRYCAACKDKKPLAEFYYFQTRGVYHCYCKDCQKVRTHNYYRRNRDKVIAQRDKYRATPEGRAAAKKSGEAAYKRYPEKVTARHALVQAVKSGRVQKPEVCDNCGASGKIHGHHPDYSKPLDVMWLCNPCHRDVHGFSLRSRGLEIA